MGEFQDHNVGKINNFKETRKSKIHFTGESCWTIWKPLFYRGFLIHPRIFLVKLRKKILTLF